MLLRPFLNGAGSCASYIFGCTTPARLAVVDAHIDLVDSWPADQERIVAANRSGKIGAPA